jgi:uncharacterized protein with PIN domain
MLRGCDHCGMVVRAKSRDEITRCPECGRALRAVDHSEARILARERRIAEQFRRADRLRPVTDARRHVGFS